MHQFEDYLVKPRSYLTKYSSKLFIRIYALEILYPNRCFIQKDILYLENKGIFCSDFHWGWIFPNKVLNFILYPWVIPVAAKNKNLMAGWNKLYNSLLMTI